MNPDQQPQDEQAIASMHYSALPQSDVWKDILRPATIFQLSQAESSPFFEDRSLVIEGRGFGAVTLVAHVARVDRLPSRITYILEDGTGRIHAEKDLSSLYHLHGASASAEEEETTQSLAFEHCYVEVTGLPQKGNPGWGPRIKIKSIYPVHDYNQVMYHILNVIHCNELIQQHVQPYNSDVDFESNENPGSDIPVNAGPIIPTCHSSLPNAFSPQRQQPYAALEPLERLIMMYMHHNKNCQVSITDLAQTIQASCGCTKHQFNLAFQTLLSEAYITSLLDDGYVVLTPRH